MTKQDREDNIRVALSNIDEMIDKLSNLKEGIKTAKTPEEYYKLAKSLYGGGNLYTLLDYTDRLLQHSAEETHEN
jgi:hypothetical protein